MRKKLVEEDRAELIHSDLDLIRARMTINPPRKSGFALNRRQTRMCAMLHRTYDSIQFSCELF